MGTAHHRPWLLLLVAILALCLIAPARLEYLEWEGGAWHLEPLSRLINSLGTEFGGSPHTDVVKLRTILADGRLQILSGARVEWVSPPAWLVADAAVTDLNHDGRDEVALVVWRAFEPWPIDKYLPSPGRISDFHNAQWRSCHLILIGERHGDFDELWAGSALADPLLQIATADLDGDGRQVLIALEGRYDDPLRSETAVTVWEWNGFGFSLRLRGPTGRFSSLALLSESGSVQILLQGHSGGDT
jgi:hypothetical protein